MPNYHNLRLCFPDLGQRTLELYIEAKSVSHCCCKNMPGQGTLPAWLCVSCNQHVSGGTQHRGSHVPEVGPVPS